MIAFYCQMNVRINKTEMKSVSPEEAKWKNFLSLSPGVSKFFQLSCFIVRRRPSMAIRKSCTSLVAKRRKFIQTNNFC